MPKQTVVLSKPRQTRVVRPPPKRSLLDLCLAIFGFGLLAVAAFLVFELPEDDVIDPQFRVSFELKEKTLPTQQIPYIDQGTSTDLFYQIEHDNVYSLLARVVLVDDIKASLPDLFQVTMRDPSDDAAGDRMSIQTPTPTYNETTLAYDVEPAEAQLQFPIRRVEADYIVTGKPGDTVEDIREEVVRNYHFPNAGNWTLHVSMIATGDCPTPQNDVNQAFACRMEDNDGADDGNTLLVSSLKYDYYNIVVERIN